MHCLLTSRTRESLLPAEEPEVAPQELLQGMENLRGRVCYHTLINGSGFATGPLGVTDDFSRDFYRRFRVRRVQRREFSVAGGLILTGHPRDGLLCGTHTWYSAAGP